MFVNLRTIFDEDGTQLDILWFYDTEKNMVMWVFPENFFRQPKEEQEKLIKKLEYISFCYCEFCDTLQRPFREFLQVEPKQILTESGFSVFGCFHASQEQVDNLNKKLKKARAERQT